MNLEKQKYSYAQVVLTLLIINLFLLISEVILSSGAFNADSIIFFISGDISRLLTMSFFVSFICLAKGIYDVRYKNKLIQISNLNMEISLYIKLFAAIFFSILLIIFVLLVISNFDVSNSSVFFKKILELETILFSFVFSFTFSIFFTSIKIYSDKSLLDI